MSFSVSETSKEFSVYLPKSKKAEKHIKAHQSENNPYLFQMQNLTLEKHHHHPVMSLDRQDGAGDTVLALKKEIAPCRNQVKRLS